MKRSVLFLLSLSILAVLFSACQPKYKKLANGVEYRIVSSGKGTMVKEGDVFEFTPYAVYSKKDSLLLTDDNRLNQLVKLDSTKIDPLFYSIFKQVREGDSIIVKEKTDSILAKGEIPWMKKGFIILQSFKIQKIYSDSISSNEAQKRLMVVARAKDSIRYYKKMKEDSIAALKQIVEDDKIVKEYLTKNKITATKTPMGTYIEMITPGVGTITDSVAVKVRYTGRNFKGVIFDSNMDPDPKFANREPMWVYLFSPNQVIRGWEDGLKQLSKGAKARFYIPSALAYGVDGRGEGSGIGPNENLIFDMEVLDIVDKEKGLVIQKNEMAKRQAQMRQQMEMQQKMQQMQQQAQQPTTK